MMKIQILLAGAALVATACGDHIDVSVDSDRVLNTLSSDEIREICTASHQYDEAFVQGDVACSILQWTSYYPGANERETAGTCARIEAEFCGQDEATDIALRAIDLSSCDLPVLAEYTLCTATVDEYLACREAKLQASIDALSSFECKPGQELPETEEAEACTILKNRCRPSPGEV